MQYRPVFWRFECSAHKEQICLLFCLRIAAQDFDFIILFVFLFLHLQTVIVAQLVRASDCGSEGRRFEPGQSPNYPAAAGFFYSRLPTLMICMPTLIKVNDARITPLIVVACHLYNFTNSL